MTSSLGFNGGTVDAAVDYATTLILPEDIQVGSFFNLSPTSAIGEVSLNTQFPKLTGQFSASLSARIDASTRSCVIAFGCSEENTNLLNIGPTGDMSLLKINTDDLPDDTASVFGLDDLAFDVTRGTVYADLSIVPGETGPVIRPVITLPFVTPSLGIGVNLGDISLDYPDFSLGGSLQEGKIVASGAVDDIVDIFADLDAAALLTGSPPLGSVTYFGPFTFRGDLLDVDVGPGMDLSQNFELTPELMVELLFDHPVWASTNPSTEITSWSGPLSSMPDFALHDDHVVNVTPTYWLDAVLKNQTSLDFNLTYSLDILKGRILGPFGILLADYVLEEQDLPVDLGSEDLFNSSFSYGGFQRISPGNFTLATSTQGGSTISAYNSHHESNGTSVPEPGTLLSFAAGLFGVVVFSGRLQKSEPGTGAPSSVTILAQSLNGMTWLRREQF